MQKILLFLACLFLSTTVYANSKNMEILGTYNDWTAYVYKDGNDKVCYMATEPEKSTGKYKVRGDVFLMVAHRTADKTYDVVNVVAGYTYKKGSKATLKIDDKTSYSLVTHADTAWAKDGATDKKLVEAMRKGIKGVLTGTSTRGTLTTDTFSYKGFGKAYEAINTACGKK